MEKAFKKEDLVELAAGGEVEGLVVLADDLIGNSRWSLNYRLVFKDATSGKWYRIFYSMGATENQDERPFDSEGDTVLCVEVYPVLITDIDYQPVGEV